MATLTAKRISKKTSGSMPAAPSSPAKIFLIGMMGSGKSYWADKLKKKLAVPAYDLDSLVEMMEEKTISEIFKEDGEEYFRKAEARMLRLFAEKKQFVLSCGGGTACYNDNMKWMNNQGITIWLDEPVETLSERLMKEKAHRPLIKDLDDQEVVNFLEKKLQERTEFYNQAAYKLGGDGVSEAALLKIVKEHA
jgi:shikimate kinase